MTIKSELEKIASDDSRHTFTDFADTFELNLFWSDNSIIKTIDHIDMRFKDFINNAVKVYREHTKKYPDASSVVQKIIEMIDRYYHQQEKIIDIRDIEQSTGLKHLTIESNLSGKSVRNVNDIYDVLDLDLIKGAKDDIFNNLISYKFVERRIMQAQVVRGNQVLTLDELARRLSIDKTYLQHPELLCKQPKSFPEVLYKLDDLIEKEMEAGKYFDKKDIRTISGLGRSIKTKPFINESYYENGLFIPLTYQNNEKKDFFIQNQDLPINLNSRSRRKQFFKKATTKQNKLKEIQQQRKKQTKHPYTLTITHAAQSQLKQLMSYLKVNRSTLIDYCIEHLNPNSKISKEGCMKYQDKHLTHEAVSVSLSSASYLKLKMISEWMHLTPGELIDYVSDEVYQEWKKYRNEIKKKSIAMQPQYSSTNNKNLIKNH